jgi:hypothetical protein
MIEETAATCKKTAATCRIKGKETALTFFPLVVRLNKDTIHFPSYDNLLKPAATTHI